ncbi:ribosomal-processing cysteine protease Prp [Aureibacillus halotolerans]|uniref:Ribosomal processing cysteine protease Prp n=1 Tax=Aureibacillus halotolerans TaxID=1508390 RepID=A0A4R6U0R4_9BACI|nr:ribosomal-processing cysteine protease Prp [Aureibacillus halotolerans]TDQ37969.1 hypothetical protein EV213_11148 [Aureibacillus halotolerans]
MITIRVTRQSNVSRIQSVEISGHAESAPYGQDLVCAAVSAVAIGGINAVIELCQLRLHVEQDDKAGGYLAVTVPAHEESEQHRKAQWLLEGMLSSLRTIEAQYGEYLVYKEQH